MTYLFACMFVVLYVIRPTDLFPDIRELPLFELAGAIGVLSLAIKRPRPRLFKNGTDQMMVGLLCAMGVSQVANGWAGGALKVVVDSSPFVLGYLLIAHGIDSERKWTGFYWTLIACAAFIVLECHEQARNGISLLGVEPLIERGSSFAEDGAEVLRVRWSGPFGDPNDLAMLLAFPLPFLANNILERRWLLSLPLLALFGYGIMLTHSRGGMLSAVAGIIALLALRKGTFKALLIPGFFAVLLLAVASGRFGEISTEDESSRGRIDAWREAMSMLRHSPLFGVGKGNFTDGHELTAHNSFFLVLAELGLFGAFFFQAIFWIPLRSLYRLAFADRPSAPTQMYACGAGLIAVLVSMMFLSRAYVLMPYIPVALWVAQGNFGDTAAGELSRDVRFSQLGKGAFKVLVASVISAYVIVKVLN